MKTSLKEDTFKLAVLHNLSAIPPGRVCSYGELARRSGLPGGARQIGRILKQLPENTSLPWHRIVLASGKLAFPENSEQYLAQKSLLEQEGIIFRACSGKLDMHCYSI